VHDTAMAFLKYARDTYKDYLSGPTLEVGSININGSARAVFHTYVPYTGVDIVAGPCVDEVVDIRDREAGKRAELSIYKLIVSTEVLEHTPPEPLLDAMLDYADPEGCAIVLTCAGPTRRPHSADGAPDVKPGEYYRNVDKSVLINWADRANVLGWQFAFNFIKYSDDQSDLYAIMYIFK